MAYSSAPGELADALQDEAERILDTGYSREVLYEDLKHLLLYLRRDGRYNLEDDVLDVMDVLTGWCAPSAQL